MPHRAYWDVTSARYRTFGKVPIPYIGRAEGQDPDASGTGQQGNNVDGSTCNSTDDAQMMFEGNGEEYNESDGAHRKHSLRSVIQIAFSGFKWRF